MKLKDELHSAGGFSGGVGVLFLICEELCATFSCMKCTVQ